MGRCSLAVKSRGRTTAALPFGRGTDWLSRGRWAATIAAHLNRAFVEALMARLTELSRSVEGKVVLVTGAGSGMGRATAFLFADEGAKVAAVDQNEEPVEAVAKAIQERLLNK